MYTCSNYQLVTAKTGMCAVCFTLKPASSMWCRTVVWRRTCRIEESGISEWREIMRRLFNEQYRLYNRARWSVISWRIPEDANRWWLIEVWRVPTFLSPLRLSKTQWHLLVFKEVSILPLNVPSLSICSYAFLRCTPLFCVKRTGYVYV